MAGINDYALVEITEDDINSEELIKVMKKYENNSRLWKYSLFAFLIALAADYLLGSFMGKDVQGGFNYTKLGTFLVILITLCFVVFVACLIRESRILKKKWTCPKCGQKLPYYISKSGGNGRFGNKEILDGLDRANVTMGRVGEKPFIVPHHCPGCRELFLKNMAPTHK